MSAGKGSGSKALGKGVRWPAAPAQALPRMPRIALGAVGLAVAGGAGCVCGTGKALA